MVTLVLAKVPDPRGSLGTANVVVVLVGLLLPMKATEVVVVAGKLLKENPWWSLRLLIGLCRTLKTMLNRAIEWPGCLDYMIQTKVLPHISIQQAHPTALVLWELLVVL